MPATCQTPKSWLVNPRWGWCGSCRTAGKPLLLLGLGFFIPGTERDQPFSHSDVFKIAWDLVKIQGSRSSHAGLTPEPQRISQGGETWGLARPPHGCQNPKSSGRGRGPLTCHDSLTGGGGLLETRPSPTRPLSLPLAQGLEIVNPQAKRRKKVAEASQKYFSSMAEFLKVKGEKSGITST